jgi:hypothetical protein
VSPRGAALAVALACGILPQLARADDPRETRSNVKPQSTVEVLDDKAQIDDVITRLRQTPAEKQATPEHAPADLKSARPPLSTVQPPEIKKQPANDKNARWRQSHRERGSGTPERTERPRHGRP